MKNSYLQRFRKFQHFLGREVWILFVKALIVGTVSFAVETSFIFVLQGFLNALGLVPANKLFLPNFFPVGVTGAVVIMLLTGVLRSVVQMLKQYYSAMTSEAFIHEQRSRLLEHCLKNAHGLSAHEVVSVFGDLIKEAGMVLLHMSRFINVATASLLMMIVGLKLAPIEFLVGFGMLAAFMLPFKVVNQKIQAHGKQLLLEWKKTNETLLLGFRNHFFLKLYGLVNSEIKKGHHYLDRYQHHYRRYQMMSAIKSGVPLIVGIVALCGLTWLSMNYIHTPGIKLLSFFYIFIRIAQGMSESSHAISTLRFNMPGFRSLYAWHQKIFEGVQKEVAPAPIDPVLEKSFEQSIQSQGLRVEAKNINFSYDRTPLIRDLSFSVGKGEVLLIRGPSGSGKSTLLTLILGLNEPQSGSLTLNGLPLASAQSFLHKNLAYVGPEPYLISGTVRDNLLYGYRDAASVSDDRLWHALERAQVKQEVMALPGQLQSHLNELTQMSTGQKQRLAIARALLRNPHLLILDEATANLDVQTEARFVAALKGLIQDLTVFIISHKESFNSLANISINMEAQPTDKGEAVFAPQF